ncbi:alpha/beta fold hydrolase [Corynebacterium suicordis]
MKKKNTVIGVASALLMSFSMAAVPVAGAAPGADSLTWGACPEGAFVAEGGVCADVEVPKDYANPQAGTITLTMSKIPAASGHARGTIAGNPGGPGGDALAMFSNGDPSDPLYENRVKMPKNVQDNYDLVALEPRGLAFGEPLTCEVGGVPAGPMALSLTAGLTREICNAVQPGYIDNVTTDNTARDLNEARKMMGLEKLSLYGLSYGGLLMSSYATQFPQHTDRTLLDSSMGQDMQWADTSNRAGDRRDSLTELFKWIADRDDEYGLGDTPLKVYQRWSQVVEKEVGVPAQLTPPPAQIGDLPPAIAQHSDVALPAVNQALPAAWRLYSAWHTVTRGKPTGTQESGLFQYTYFQALYNEDKRGKVAEYIRDGKLQQGESAMPDVPDSEEVMQDIMNQQLTMGMVERAILCNENRYPIEGERTIPQLVDSMTGGDVINTIELSFKSGQNCIGWPLPRPAMTVNGDTLEVKPLLIGFDHDSAVRGTSIWDMQRRMGGEVVVVSGHSHGVLLSRSDEVAAKVSSYFGV